MKLMEQVRKVLRVRHYSLATEPCYLLGPRLCLGPHCLEALPRLPQTGALR